MALNLALPSTVDIDIDNQSITIEAFNTKESKQNLHKQAINIIASGPSITHLQLSEILAILTILSTVVLV